MFLAKKKVISDWKNPDVIPQEVLSRKELDRLEAGTILDIQRNQVMKPQVLFYLHKYIDAKFNKNGFDVDTYYSKKQNLLDELYATGLSEVYSTFTGYQELMHEQKEVSERYFRTMKKLGAEPDDSSLVITDDSREIEAEINALPSKIQWGEK